MNATIIKEVLTTAAAVINGNAQMREALGGAVVQQQAQTTIILRTGACDIRCKLAAAPTGGQIQLAISSLEVVVDEDHPLFDPRVSPGSALRWRDSGVVFDRIGLEAAMARLIATQFAVRSVEALVPDTRAPRLYNEIAQASRDSLAGNQVGVDHKALLLELATRTWEQFRSMLTTGHEHGSHAHSI